MPRKLPPHIVLPNGQWRFVKRGSRSGMGTSKRRRVSMARYRRRSRRRVGRVYSRRRRYSGGGGMRIGGMKGPLAVAIAGVADAVINPRSPINGIGSIAVGFLMKNDFAKNVGFYQAGQSMATYIPYVGAQAGGVASQV